MTIKRSELQRLADIVDGETNKAYSFDWTQELAGETIQGASSAWSVDGDAGIVSASATDSTATVVLQAGKVGTRNLITNSITTDPSGQRLKKSAAVLCVAAS